MNAKEEVLKGCTIDGNIVKLPEGQLERKLYEDVAKALNLIGGKWKGAKVFGFVFQEDPTELLAQISNGEKRNLKKEFQFFATPDKLADYMVELGVIDGLNRNSRVCEPSAGQGSIVKSILKNKNIRQVSCCELMPINKTFLDKIDGVLFEADDFLSLPYSFNNYYDRIIANPPFTKNQDIDHIYKMYDVLKPGGRMVSIASIHWQSSNNKKETEFREWLQDKGADIESIEKGAFKDSGTMVGGVIITINK